MNKLIIVIGILGLCTCAVLTACPEQQEVNQKIDSLMEATTIQQKSTFDPLPKSFEVTVGGVDVSGKLERSSTWKREGDVKLLEDVNGGCSLTTKFRFDDLRMPFNASRRTFIKTQRDAGYLQLPNAFGEMKIIVSPTVQNKMDSWSLRNLSTSAGDSTNISAAKEAFTVDIMKLAARSLKTFVEVELGSAMREAVSTQMKISLPN